MGAGEGGEAGGTEKTRGGTICSYWHTNCALTFLQTERGELRNCESMRKKEGSEREREREGEREREREREKG